MTKYRVPVALVFTGAVLVNAKDESHAEEIAVWEISGRLGNVSDNNSTQVLDYEFDIRPETIVRDDESIEEVEEEDESD